MTIEIIFETHSTSEDNEYGRATGWLPGKLSATGRRQARELGLRRSDDGIAAVFSSDLGRAVETARIAFANDPTGGKAGGRRSGAWAGLSRICQAAGT
jgi:2,3-bisphosphoglycerate-dependent phosphoglycerate mutase